jgi:hypothetical protein
MPPAGSRQHKRLRRRWGKVMQIGIAAYFRNLAVRCNKIARACPDARTHDALADISAELAEKAEALETTFKVPKENR